MLGLWPNALELDGIYAKVQLVNNSNHRHHLLTILLNTYYVPDKHYHILSSKRLFEKEMIIIPFTNEKIGAQIVKELTEDLRADIGSVWLWNLDSSP